MTEWKAGDRAMVEIAEVKTVVNRVFVRLANFKDWFEDSHLHPLPSAITPEERVVVEAAVEWQRNARGSLAKLYEAVDALIASRKPPEPPNPYADLIEAAMVELDKPGAAGVFSEGFFRALAAARADLQRKAGAEAKL